MNLSEIEQQLANEVFLQTGLVVQNNHSVCETRNRYCNVEGLQIEIEGPRRSFYHFDAGKLHTTIKVGGIMNDIRPRTFRQKKDGTFNFDKICTAIVEELDGIVRRDRKREQERKQSKSAYNSMKELNKKYGEYEWSPLSVNRFNKLEIKLTGDAERMEKILKLLQDNDIQF